MLTIGYKLAVTVVAAMFLFTVVSVTILDYLSARAVWAGEHSFSFSHLQDSDPAQLHIITPAIQLHLIHRQNEFYINLENKEITGIVKPVNSIKLSSM